MARTFVEKNSILDIAISLYDEKSSTECAPRKDMTERTAVMQEFTLERWT